MGGLKLPLRPASTIIRRTPNADTPDLPHGPAPRSGTPNHRRPSTFSAACLGCGQTLLTAVFAAFLLLTSGNAYAQDSVESDRAALVALYNATGGANWTDNTNWLSDEPLSEWQPA